MCDDDPDWYLQYAPLAQIVEQARVWESMGNRERAAYVWVHAVIALLDGRAAR